MKVLLIRGHEFLIDDASFDAVSAFRWGLLRMSSGYLYAATTTKPRLLLHRVITNCPKGLVVDHINGSTLDNRLSNLRVISHAENIQNRAKKAPAASKYKGVTRQCRMDAWVARIGGSGDRKCLGTFRSEIDAAVAYDGAAVERYGEYACLNFPHMHTERAYRSALKKF